MADQLYVPDSVRNQDANATSGTEDELLKEHAATAPKEVETAFVVFLDEEGTWVGASDLTLVKPMRQANLNDMFAGCSTVVSDVQASKTAQHVQAMQMATMRQMQEQMQSQQILQRLQGLKK